MLPPLLFSMADDRPFVNLVQIPQCPTDHPLVTSFTHPTLCLSPNDLPPVRNHLCVSPGRPARVAIRIRKRVRVRMPHKMG